MYHRNAHLFECAREFRHQVPEYWEHPVDVLVKAERVLLPGCWFHKTGAEGIKLFEHLSQIILGSALYSCPHHAAFFGAVGTGTRHVAKCHVGVTGSYCFGKVHGERVGVFGILFFVLADRRNPQAEETGIIAGQFMCNWRQVEEIFVDDLLQFGVAETRWTAVNNKHLRNIGVEQALEHNTFAYHAGGPGNDRFEWHR